MNFLGKETRKMDFQRKRESQGERKGQRERIRMCEEAIGERGWIPQKKNEGEETKEINILIFFFEK